MVNPILEFRGSFDFLSNFYVCKVTWMGIEWPSSENAYQAAKCHAPEEWHRFVDLTPGQAKKLGQRIKMREDWDQVKYDIMLDIVREKFMQNIDLMEKLLATGNAPLQEGNWWGDRYWGVSPAGSGNGKNNLGKILESIRKEFSVAFTERQDQGIIYYDSRPEDSFP